jgi:hypothetical protein
LVKMMARLAFLTMSYCPNYTLFHLFTTGKFVISSQNTMGFVSYSEFLACRNVFVLFHLSFGAKIPASLILFAFISHLSISGLIVHSTKLLNSDWSRAVQ